ncbi:MAG: alpha-D-ribose 1-methylphosphonate 5-triphosphate diphosphatase [Paracoccaceae bacterium]
MTQSATAEMCLANADIVLPDRVMRGAVHVAAGKIVALDEGDRLPEGAIDCAGDVLIPGLIELHTDNLERHMEPRPDVKMPNVTAILAHDGELASAGITTVFDALRVGSIGAANKAHGRAYARQLASDLLALRDADALRLRHMIHLRAEICSETLIDELADFGPEDRIGLVSVMDHTPGQRQFRDLDKLRIYYRGKYSYSDTEFDAVVAQRRALGGRVRAAHEACAVSEAGRLGAVLASHDDTTRAQVMRSADLGMALAEFPTTKEAAETCRARGTHIIMGAPNLIRGRSHSGNVSARELAELGLLDIVSSDYVPALLMASVFHLADLWNDLPRAVRCVTQTPARATGLKDRGQIAPGTLADLVRVRRVHNTPVIRSVWRGGRQIG